MELTHIVAFNVALLAAIASPGPALLVAIKTSLSAGRNAGIAIGAGLGLVASLWTFAALVGLEVVFALFPWAFSAAKLIGAMYLIYIAYGMWAGARSPISSDTKPAAQAFRQGVMINLLNPKSVLFAAAVLVVIFPSGMNMNENLVIVANHFFVEVLFYTCLAIAMSSPSVSQRYMRAKVYIDRTAALILGAFGLRLVFER